MLFCASKLMCGIKGTEDADANALSGRGQKFGKAGKLRRKPQQRLCGAQNNQVIECRDPDTMQSITVAVVGLQICTMQ